jgi:hypothetical protein
MDGITTITKLKEIHPAIRTVLLTPPPLPGWLEPVWSGFGCSLAGCVCLLMIVGRCK